MSAIRSRIIVWDVGQGTIISIMTPNGRTTMIELGANVETGFSPVKFTKSMWGLTQLDYLILSHPHLDHIRDIVNLEGENLSPTVLRARNVPRENLIQTVVSEDDREVFEAYLRLKARYSHPVDASRDPGHSSWGSGGYFSNYSVDAD